MTKANEFTHHTYTIQDEDIGLRLDKILIKHEKILSRSQATKLFKSNFISINNKPAKPSHIVHTKEIIHFKLPVYEDELAELQPYDRPLNIIYQDDDVLVINKPAGLVMHPSPGHSQDSLVNVLLSKNITLSTGSQLKRPGIVHRIDKDTSGLVVVAKNNEAHIHLAKQFEAKTVHRIYHAVTYGYLKKTNGTLVSHLIRHPKDRKKISNERIVEGTEPKGKIAITHYDLLHQKKGLSLIKCQLETGRTHQIRVHLSEINHPIINDPIYSSNRILSNIESKHIRSYIKVLPGIGLLAKELGFIHPRTKEKISFTCTWPIEFEPLLSLMSWKNE